MGMQLVAALLLIALVGGSKADGVPEDLFFIMSIIKPFATCEFGTLSCSNDCSHIQMCMDNGIVEEVITCPANTLCDSRNNTCKPEADVVCLPLEPDVFTCHGKRGGNFPHPYDCHKYYKCPDIIGAPEPGVVQECDPLQNAFDPLLEMCILPWNHRVCTESPVPKCKVALQSGPLIENPNIYYVCVSSDGVNLEPILAKCDRPELIFQNGKCVDGSVETTTSGTGPTTTSGLPTTTKYKCPYPGSTFPDMEDCQGYYLCTTDNEPIHFTCRDDYHYSCLYKKCVEGLCTQIC